MCDREWTLKMIATSVTLTPVSAGVVRGLVMVKDDRGPPAPHTLA